MLLRCRRKILAHKFLNDKEKNREGTWIKKKKKVSFPLKKTQNPKKPTNGKSLNNTPTKKIEM